jgi:hypothetical protein
MPSLLRRRSGRQPIRLLYVMCDGCYDVTAHLTSQVTAVPLRGSQYAETASLVEIICRSCGWVQPRVVGDEVSPQVILECRRRQRLMRRGWRRCQKVFIAPASAAWPTCPWCGSLAWPAQEQA